MNMSNTKSKNNSHIINAIIFMITSLLLVSGTLIYQHFQKDFGNALDWKIFTVANGSDFNAISNGKAYDTNINPFLFSFIEINNFPAWATYLTSGIAIFIAASFVVVVKRKSTIVFLSILVAALSANLIDALFMNASDYSLNASSDSVIFGRNFYFEWLGGIGMNLTDMIALFSSIGFVVYWIVLLVIYLINNKNNEEEQTYKPQVSSDNNDYSNNQKTTEPRRQQMIIEPVEEPEIVTPYIPQQDAPVFKQTRESQPQVATPSQTPVTQVDEAPVFKQARSSQPVEVVNTPAPEMSRVAEPKPVIEPAPVFKQERTPQPQVVTPTSTPVAPITEAPVFKQERAPQPQAVTPTPTPVVPVSPKTTTPKTAEELEEEAMRESLASLRDAW